MAAMKITETETVIKRILPYLVRRNYDIEQDLTFEEAVEHSDNYKKGYVDILVTAGKKKPQFVIEAKRATRNLTEKDRKQAINYGKSLKTLFVVLTNGNEIQCFNTVTGEAILWDGQKQGKIPTKRQLGKVLTRLKANPNATIVPLKNDDSLPFRPSLPLKQLNALFKRCHNQIRKIEKNEETAFADFAKLLFLKLLEEKHDTEEDFNLPYSYRYHELADYPSTAKDQVKTAILSMLGSIRDQTAYGQVLAEPLFLKNPATYQYIIKQLASVSFVDSSVDSKGAAFEYYVRATLKGKKLGQYFTPRPLVELMSSIVGSEKILDSILAGGKPKVLDPACGTGGFLVFLMQNALAQLASRSQRKITKSTATKITSQLKANTFFGSDANEGVASAAKMNMIIAGDGHTNIRAEDSLAPTAQNWSMDNPNCDLILTNPPFGTSESASLSARELSDYPISNTKGQILFLQKMVLSVVSGGEICTVIDEGVLNNESFHELRKWLLQKCILKSVVRLPVETFKPNKINVRTSLLYLVRREEDNYDLDDDYEIIFCDLHSLGYQGSGDSIRGFDFAKMKQDIARIFDNQINFPFSGYSLNAFETNSLALYDDTTCRFDLKYWLPDVRDRIESLLEAKNGETIEELNTLETSRGKSPLASSYVDREDGFALVVKAGSNISKFGELIEQGDFIEKNAYDELNSSGKDLYLKLKQGDVLLASTGTGTLGKCCVFHSDLPAIADGHVTVIRVDSDIIYPEYLCDYLRRGFGQLQINRLFTGSTGLIELTPSHVKSIVIETAISIEQQKQLSRSLRDAENSHNELISHASEVLSDAIADFRHS